MIPIFDLILGLSSSSCHSTSICSHASVHTFCAWLSLETHYTEKQVQHAILGTVLRMSQFHPPFSARWQRLLACSRRSERSLDKRSTRILSIFAFNYVASKIPLSGVQWQPINGNKRWTSSSFSFRLHPSSWNLHLCISTYIYFNSRSHRSTTTTTRGHERTAKSFSGILLHILQRRTRTKTGNMCYLQMTMHDYYVCIWETPFQPALRDKRSSYKDSTTWIYLYRISTQPHSIRIDRSSRRRRHCWAI